jgi:hypothetical protein
VCLVGQRLHVDQTTVGRRVLRDHAEVVAGLLHRIGNHHLDAERPRAGLDHRQGLRMQVRRHDHPVALRLADAQHRRHRLGRRSRLVQQRGVGEVEPGQVHHHLLIGQQRLEPALAHLGLIGRVGGVPARVLQHVPLDHRRRDRIVVAHADQRRGVAVLRGVGGQPIERLALGQRARQCQRPRAPDLRRNRGGRHRLEIVVAERRQHRLLLVRARPDVAPGEIVVLQQLLERGPGHGLSPQWLSAAKAR